MSKRMSNEEIAAAVMAHGANRAGEVLGIDRKTVYQRMKTGEYQAVYRELKNRVLEATADRLSGAAGKAIDTIEEIMGDGEQTGAARLHAAELILKYTYKDIEAKREQGWEGKIIDGLMDGIIA